MSVRGKLGVRKFNMTLERTGPLQGQLFYLERNFLSSKEYETLGPKNTEWIQIMPGQEL